MSTQSKRRIRVYLAGKVPKGAAEEAAAIDWRGTYAAALSEVGDFETLSPEDPTLDENYPERVFGHDCYLIRECDMVIINAMTKLGVGTAQEMLIAKYFNKHVFTVLPKDSHHRRSNLKMNGIHVAEWVHPFLYCTSDAIFEDLDALCRALADADATLAAPAKTLKIIDHAVSEYLCGRRLVVGQ